MINTKSILNACGEKIFVETYTPEQYTECVVFCHGITGCRKGRTMADSYLQELAQKLMENNVKAVLFDYSGHGESEGNDFNVTLSKSTNELELVFQSEVDKDVRVSFLAFSYGASVLSSFLTKHSEISPSRILLYSPCIYPNESCFLNVNSVFGKDVVKSYICGEIEEQGYAVVGAKGFRLGKAMLDECRGFKPHGLDKFADRTLVLSGSNDVILNTKYNDLFCEKNSIKNIYFEASHSLFETIGPVFEKSLSFLLG